MTRNAEATGMGESVAVYEQQIRAMLQGRDRLQPDRSLPERKEAGDVRERHRPLDDALFDRFKVWKAQRDDRCTPDLAAVRRLGKAEIDAGHRPDLAEAILPDGRPR